MRQLLRKALVRVHLLDPVLRVRELAGAVRFMRSNLRYWFQSSPDGLPLPTLGLIAAATGQADMAWYLEGGRLAKQAICASLDRAHVDVHRLNAVLDFGCGCGRVLRQWRSAKGVRICGSDYNQKMAAWCDEHLPFVESTHNDLQPPLVYPDDTFDLVYALSVFTHMPEALQHAWISELRRVLRPGGYLYFTTHGERYLEHLASDEQASFQAGNLVVKHADSPGTNRCGAYHPKGFVEKKLAKGLALIEHRAEGALGNPYQDSYLFMKPPA